MPGIRSLTAASLKYYWRTNLAVVAGAAVAVAVLAGASMAGDSVRSSLRELVLKRLGKTGSVIAAQMFFREALAREFPGACPLVTLDGVVTGAGGRRAYGVSVFGVDERFFAFHGYTDVKPPSAGAMLVSAALAEELGAKPRDSLLLRVPKPSAIPHEWLHGRKEDSSRALRLTFQDAGPDFSLRPGQGPVRAVYVPLRRLQRDLDIAGKANAILLPDERTEAAAKTLRDKFTLEDFGLRLRGQSLESEGALISDAVAEAARFAGIRTGVETTPVFTYLANSIGALKGSIPYSLVTAIDRLNGHPLTGLTLNQWAASDLAARVGDAVTLEFYVWKEDGRLATERASFPLAAIVPLANDRTLAPEYKGMTDSESLHDWDPPFPVDLSRVRPKDEAYWKQYRTTPKAYLPLGEGQKLWGSRFGKLTSVRLSEAKPEFAAALRGEIDPLRAGFTILAARAEALEASRGSTDFGEYFLYFSFFLVASALLLVGLFFKLGVEQRLKEIGLLGALGFQAKQVRRLFLREGLVLAVAGALAGVAGAVAYAALILHGLRTWWVGAVGTRDLSLSVSPGALAGGAVGGVATALICVALALRALRRSTARGLLAGDMGASAATAEHPRRTMLIGAVAAAGAIGLLAASAAKAIDPAGGFFGSAALLLAACLCFASAWLRRRPRTAVHSLPLLGWRNVAYRPNRSVLSMALIAFATFLIVSLDAFRRPETAAGEWPLMAESILPVYHDLNSQAGRDAVSLPPLDGVRFAAFRVRAGEDASCLNLYRPRNPRVIGAPALYVQGRQDPWTLIQSAPGAGGEIPALVDANSLEYVLHRKVGDVIALDNGVKLRVAGALRDSVFQRELIISEQNFKQAFPQEQGYRLYLIDAPAARLDALSAQLEDGLSDYGFDVTSTTAQLAAFHRVENTYLSTFQSLGALGLLLGTVGLAAILLRNVLETRRELALLEAVGYRTSHLAQMVLSENVLLLAGGLGIGAACAAVAVAPVVAARANAVPAGSMIGLIAGVFAVGMAASLVAIAAVHRMPVLATLREE